MRFTSSLLTPTVFVIAAILAIGAAWGSMFAVERASSRAVSAELMLHEFEWVNVRANGLQVILTGEAPDEATRFRAITIAGQEIDASRVIDQMRVPPAEAITPPRFSIEILRNDAGISMIGLIPAATDREALTRRVRRITPDDEIADFLETADYDVPAGWDNALEYGLTALAMLPRAKISLDANMVSITAIADSAEEKIDWSTRLSRATPGGLRVALDISAPRPVITPFTLRFTIDSVGARFDACSAHTEEGRTRIVAAGIAAGVKGRPDCTIGLGVPSPDWPAAVSRAIEGLAELGAGSITFSDADVTLVAAPEVPQASFDRVVGELEADLPEVFSLHAVLSDPVTIDGTGESQAPEFVATKSPEGLVQLRGRLTDEAQRTVTESVAKAHFGTDNVYAAARLDPDLPQGWSVRVLAGLEALSYLDNGAVVVQPEVVDVRGQTGNADASAEISRILSEKLGEAEDFRVNVTYIEALDPIAALPTPEECLASVQAVLANNVKITFAPGSTDIMAGAGPTLDALAEVLKTCPDVAMEIGGHTDSQGREEMNKGLSQARADAVLTALLARRVLTSNLTAHGYGEEQPIADNDTEEGREANRRIEFRLIDPEGEAEAAATGDEAAAEPGEDEGGNIAPDDEAASEIEALPEETGSGDDILEEEGSGDEVSGEAETGAEAEAETEPEAETTAEAAPEAETEEPALPTEVSVEHAPPSRPTSLTDN